MNEKVCAVTLPDQLAFFSHFRTSRNVGEHDRPRLRWCIRGPSRQTFEEYSLLKGYLQSFRIHLCFWMAKTTFKVNCMVRWKNRAKSSLEWPCGPSTLRIRGRAPPIPMGLNLCPLKTTLCGIGELTLHSPWHYVYEPSHTDYLSVLLYSARFAWLRWRDKVYKTSASTSNLISLHKCSDFIREMGIELLFWNCLKLSNCDWQWYG